MSQATLTAYTALLDDIRSAQAITPSPAIRILLEQLATGYRCVLDQIKAKLASDPNPSMRPAEDLIEALADLERTHHDPAIRAIAARCATMRRFP